MKARHIGPASARGTQPVKMEYMSGEGISSAAKATIINERDGKSENRKRKLLMEKREERSGDKTRSVRRRVIHPK